MKNLFTPTNNKAFEIASTKYPCFDMIFNDYEIYDITNMPEEEVKRFIDKNKLHRNLKISATFHLSNEKVAEDRKKLLILVFLRTSITEYSSREYDEKLWWLRSNTVFRYYFDDLALDIINTLTENENDEYIQEIIDNAVNVFIEDFNDFLADDSVDARYPIYGDLCNVDYMKHLEEEIVSSERLIYVGRDIIKIDIKDAEEEINEILESYYKNMVIVDNRMQLIEKKRDDDVFAKFTYGKGNRSRGVSVKTDYGYALILDNASDL